MAIGMLIEPSWQQPSHPGLIEVVQSDVAFGIHAVSKTSLPAGAFVASIDKYHFVDKRSYATVEACSGRHFELDSDLLYTNHSCEPTLEFDVARMEVRVSRNRELKKGDELTWFYPSTELYMAQKFVCHCGKLKCKKYIAGAAEMEPSQLGGYWLNRHVEEPLAEKATDGVVGMEKRERHELAETQEANPT